LVFPGDTMLERKREAFLVAGVRSAGPAQSDHDGKTAPSPGFSSRRGPLVFCRTDQRVDLGGLEQVAAAEDRFDLILSVGEADQNEIERALTDAMPRASNPLAPLISHVPGLGWRVDFTISDASPASIASAILLAQPMMRRVAQLPAIPLGPDRNRVLALALAHTRQSPIEAAWAPDKDTMIGYPLLLGIAEPRRLLEELADEGLLHRMFFDRLFVCGHCGSSRLMVREVCVQCHSSELHEESLIHHYHCGYQAAESRFRRPDGGYQCPKCSRHLRHYGQDYDKPNKILQCGHCDDHMSEPEANLVCTDCRHDQLSDSAKRVTWYHYELTSDGISAVESGTLARHGGNTARDTGRGRSLRDFRVLGEQLLSLAAQHGRPITALRLSFDIERLRETYGHGHAAEIVRLAQEIAGQCLYDSDVLAVLPDGIAACLPETDYAGAKEFAKQMASAIGAALKSGINPKLEIFDSPESIAQFVQDLR
jgi:Thaumarchaeal output domain 1